MQVRPMSAHQISIMDQTEPLWCERTQDMSGYVLPDIISPPLDEQLDFTYSTAQTENDFFVQNSANPSSPEEFFWGDQTETVLGEDSNMFDNSNYSELHNKMKEWLPNISSTEIDEFAKTTMINNNEDLMPQVDSENSLVFSKSSKVDKTPSAAVIKKSRHLSIFDCEEPHIKEESDFLSSCCTDVKSNFDLRDEMVAEEVEVTTEEHEGPDSKSPLSSFLFNSASPELLIEPKQEEIIPSDAVEDLLSPLSGSAMETSYDLDIADEDDLYSFDASPAVNPMSRVCPQLYLNIEAAMVSSSHLLSGDLPDTPEVLRPVLKPTDDFDLVNYLLANNGDSNNAITPCTSNAAPTVKRLPEQSQPSPPEIKYGRGKPSFMNWGEWCNPTPGPSSVSGRPERKSATKFKRLLEEGRLGSPVSSDDEVSAPKTKRRRTSSTRKRHNSDSDRSSVGENTSRYRERRDRNNLSSKRSRQKRKMQQELKKMELAELEEENKRLKKRADELAAVLDRVHKAWKKYLVNNVRKEN